MAYITEKLSRNCIAIRREGFDEILCFLKPKEVASWIFRAEKADAENVQYEIERRARRLEIVGEYLAKRAARPVQLQLSLF